MIFLRWRFSLVGVGSGHVLKRVVTRRLLRTVVTMQRTRMLSSYCMVVFGFW